MRVKAEVLDKAGSIAKLHAAGGTGTDIWNKRLDTLRYSPVLFGHVLLEPFELMKGARAPRASELDGVVGLKSGLFLRVVGMVSRERNASWDSNLKEVLGGRIC